LQRRLDNIAQSLIFIATNHSDVKSSLWRKTHQRFFTGYLRQFKTRSIPGYRPHWTKAIAVISVDEGFEAFCVLLLCALLSVRSFQVAGLSRRVHLMIRRINFGTAKNRFIRSLVCTRIYDDQRVRSRI
jgi:hypothetical protein